MILMSFSHVFITIALLTIVGAVIGGVTNYIAIKMLFKPTRAIMIGRFRLPFTPGLIPRRREEIAVQLGRLVMKHLITEDRLRMKIQDPAFAEQMNHIAEKRIREWLDQSGFWETPLSRWVDADVLTENIRKKLEGALRNHLQSSKSLTMNEVMGSWAIESRLPKVAQWVARSLIAYLDSPEGRNKVLEQLNAVFAGKGFFGNILGLFLGNQSLVEKIYSELLALLKRPDFAAMIEAVLNEEWQQLKKRSLDEVLTAFQPADWASLIIERLPLEKWGQLPPQKILGDFKEDWLNAIPKVVHSLLNLLAERVPEILETLNLAALVTDQVRQFSIQELEDVVLMISKKEFKMITYLGALLGGVIGFIQAGIVLMLG
jgi:uncharacterized membrane protein YheB (UPF0754 family)